MYKILLGILACLSIKTGYSQKNELSGLVTIESPKGDLGKVYSPGPMYQIAYSSNTKYKKKWSSVGVNVGYLAMSPSQSVFSYPVVTDLGTETGRATYSPYKIYQVVVTKRVGRQLSKGVDMFGGSDIGVNFTSYDYTVIGPGMDDSGSNRIMRYVVVPKLGFDISLNKSICLVLQARFVFSLGNNDNESSILNTYLSLGGGVVCRF